MGSPVLRLDTEDLCVLAPECDPVEAVAEELLARPDDGRERRAGRDGLSLELCGDLAVLRDPDTGTRCALPVSDLLSCRAAALTALAANNLLEPGLVTVSLIGSGSVGRIQLLVIARNVPDVSHIAVHPPGDGHDSPVDRGVADALEEAGIGLTVTSRADEATFGANLVAVTGPTRQRPCLGRLSPGAVLVNATGHDLSDDMADCVSAVYVDDLGLVEGAVCRCPVPCRPTGTGSPRARWPRRIEADLRQVFTGEHPGRSCADHILLVELLSAAVPDAALDAALATRIHRAALRHGRGVLTSG